MDRPEVVKDEHLTYLDELRESGITNMFGAGSYIESSFDVSHPDSRIILSYWMESFGRDDK